MKVATILMQPLTKKTDILIVGAGMAGLCAATNLQQAGHDVLVIDKGRGLGGRMASRRINIGTNTGINSENGEAHFATFDHGAQFITARDERFKALVDDCTQARAAKEWYRTKSGEVVSDGSGHARWCGQPSITAIAKHLAKSLTVQGQARLSTLKQEGDGWLATLESGEVIQAKAVLLTPPVPQVLDLLKASEVVLPTELAKQLDTISYERCIAVMAVLESPSGIKEPGSFSGIGDTIALIVDNQQKGISQLPALTIHATPEFSLKHWEDDRAAAGQLILDAAQSMLGDIKVTEHQTHGWLYSRPHKVEEASHVVLNNLPPLLMAGDAFGATLTGSYVEPRVEGAALSGWAAAEALEILI